jgi:hypothetical protein
VSGRFFARRKGNLARVDINLPRKGRKAKAAAKKAAEAEAKPKEPK